MSNLFKSLGLALSVALITAQSGFANQNTEASLVGSWHSAGVKCVGPSGSKDPNYNVSVNLDMKANNQYSAVGSVAGFTCNLSGTYSEKGNTVTFKLGNSGCPISSYIGSSFSATVRGNKMSASFGTKIGDKICPDPQSRVIAYMVK